MNTKHCTYRVTGSPEADVVGELRRVVLLCGLLSQLDLGMLQHGVPNGSGKSSVSA